MHSMLCVVLTEEEKSCRIFCFAGNRKFSTMQKRAHSKATISLLLVVQTQKPGFVYTKNSFVFLVRWGSECDGSPSKIPFALRVQMDGSSGGWDCAIWSTELFLGACFVPLVWVNSVQWNCVDVLCSNLQCLGNILRLLALQYSSWRVFTHCIQIWQV